MEYEPYEPRETEEKEPTTTLKVIVLIVLIALLIAGIILPIKLVPSAFSNLGTKISDFFNGQRRIVLVIDKDEINSGDPFTLSWTGEHRTDGAYVLSYGCVNGVRLETSANRPFETIACDSKYFFTPSDNSISLTPYSTASAYADDTLSLSFLENGSTDPKPVADLAITIINKNLGQVVSPSPTPSVKPTASPTPTSKPTPSSTPSPRAVTTPRINHRVSNPNGKADLAITITSTGYVDPIYQRYIPSKYVPANTLGYVKFTVTNKGNKNTGIWSFLANLPSSTHPIYAAYGQRNLGPGDSIAYTLSFSDVVNIRNSLITLSLDPVNAISEYSEINNTAQTYLYSSIPTHY